MLLVWDVSISSSTPLFSNLEIRVCFKVHFCICICWQIFFFPCRLNSLSYPGWMRHTMRYQLFKMLCQKSSLILLWQVLVKPMGWGGMEKHCWNQKLLALCYPLDVSRMFVIYIYIYIWVRFKCWIMWPPNAHEACSILRWLEIKNYLI